MPDVASSTAATSPTALLFGGADTSCAHSTTAKDANPFAALMAETIAPKGGVPAKTSVADTIAALVAGSTPSPSSDADPLPTNADAHSADLASDSDDKDADSRGTDPLADAIASGATAVLAIAPAIVPPAAPEPATPVKIEDVIPTKALMLAGRGTTIKGQSYRPTAKDEANAKGDDSTPKTPAPATAPTPIELAPDVSKAVVAALQTDANKGGSDAALIADTNADQAAAQATTAAKADQPNSALIQQGHGRETPVQPKAQGRRGGDEVAAPRRASDARKRVDPSITDAASTGATGQNPDVSARTTPLHALVQTQTKGDAIVHQTLTIARDGAWLDRLAHDIANASSGNDLHFKLEPQNLGSLSVAISQGDDGASIRMTTDSERTRDILVAAQPKLMAEARAQGLRVSDTQIDVSQDQSRNPNQGSSQDSQRWAHNQSGQGNMSQNGQNQQSSPGHQPFVSNLQRRAEPSSESHDRDSDALYA